MSAKLSHTGRKGSLRSSLTLVLALYWLALFVGTHIPNPQDFLPEDVSDKTLHLLAYAGLATLLLVRERLVEWVTWGRGLTLLAVVVAYGALDELLQAIPSLNRTADFGDWAADVLGASTALAVFLLVQWTLRRLSEVRQARLRSPSVSSASKRP